MLRRLSPLVVVALLAAACAGDSEPGATRAPERGPFPVTVAAANGEVTVPSRPQRIVSLSPTATEILFAVGAGPRVVAVDDQSSFPPEAPGSDLSGYEPNVEAIASYDPDLVVFADDPGGLGASLAALGIPAISQPAATDLTDTYAQIEQTGEVTGNAPGAERLVAEMQEQVADVVRSIPAFPEQPTYYHELDDTYYTATSDTFIGQVYALAGLRNIADEAKGAGSGYPQLTAEYLLDADPDLIFLADTRCCGQTAETVAQRPGWRALTAVREGHVIELDDDVASRWGPRVVELLEDVAGAVRELEAV